ncbi:MAG: helix-turn-helix domain-containing protein [Burkholderiaceae bacterium]|nr:helix-turn-helix domain-containing protein [Burkholderiaceae bacterium]
MQALPGAAQLRTHSALGWKVGVHDNFLPLEVSITRGADFHAALTARQLGAAQLAYVDADAHRVTRTRTLSERSESAFLKLFWQVGGASRLEQAGRRSELTPGAWTFYDTSRPYSIEIGDASQFVVALLPLDAYPEWKSLATDGLGQSFRSTGASRVALGSVLSALRDPQACDPASAEAVCTSIAGLMLAAAQSASDVRGTRVDAQLARARRYIASRIEDPELSPDTVAAGLRVSRRTLYAWFEPIGQSPGAFIQQTRLDRCRRALLDADSRDKTITRIAFDNGFSDMAHFSRLFKAAFGAGPREYRRRAQT